MADAAQRLFEQYADDAAKPHAGDHFKDFVRVMLLRAAEAGVYCPPPVADIEASLKAGDKLALVKELIDMGVIKPADAKRILKGVGSDAP